MQSMIICSRYALLAETAKEEFVCAGFLAFFNVIIFKFSFMLLTLSVSFIALPCPLPHESEKHINIHASN